MKTETFAELSERIYCKIIDETYQEIADMIFTLAKEKHIVYLLEVCQKITSL